MNPMQERLQPLPLFFSSIRCRKRKKTNEKDDLPILARGVGFQRRGGEAGALRIEEKGDQQLDSTLPRRGKKKKKPPDRGRRKGKVPRL